MDKHQKKQIKKYITYSMIAFTVLILAVMPLIASRNIPEDGPRASILSAAAENRTIESQLIGGGLLSSDATEEIHIPAKVKLTEYLVGNGDIVAEGEAIARVDKVSILSALAEVQETLDYLSEEIADAGSGSDTDTVTAHAGGLVKHIYAQPGDSVRDVMLRDGALAVLSLDGRMAVDIERSTDLKPGSTVCIYLSDGTELEGMVESSAGGTLTVSVEDKGYAVGETVVVKTDDGARLGSGELYIHNAWNASAYYGTVSKVNVMEGATVSAGKPLFSLEISNYSSQFWILNAQRQEYEELMLELFQMYESGVVSAPCSGIVTGVDAQGSFLLTADAEQGWQIQLLSNVVWDPQPDYSVMLLGNRRPGFRPSKPSEPSEPSDDDQADDDNTTETTYTVEVGYVNGDGTVTLCSTHYGITDLESFVPTTTSSDKVETWDTSVLYNRDLTLYTDAVTEGDMLFRATDNTTNAVYCIYAAVPSSEDTGTDDSTGADDSAQQGQAGAVGGMGGGSRGNSSAPAFEPYTLDQLTVASVTSQEHMSLEITVDEQDIFRLYTGQEAVITVEALTGQTFPAVVTNVSNTGTNEGGSSKFTARLTLNKSGDMLPGMNASAFLTLNTAENTISVPVAALVEENGQTIVYTGYNENDDVLTKPVTVTTGLSDGEYVQILSGLREGDAIYYAYYDTPEISTIPERRRFGF